VALKQNTSTIASLPLRFRGGALGMQRAFWGRTELRNITAGQGLADNLGGIPSGHRHPSAWLLPQSPGALSAFVSSQVQLTVSPLIVAAGRNVVGSSSITFTIGPSQLELIVSASGSATATWTLSGTLAAAVGLTGASSITFTVGPTTLGAIIDALGTSPVTFVGSATVRATGSLAGDITPFTTLSPENLAQKVWQYVIESGYSAEQIMRVLTSVAAGKSDIVAGGGGSATVTFRDLADTKDRVSAGMTGSERTTITLNVTP
jgi:hypothetical protein